MTSLSAMSPTLCCPKCQSGLKLDTELCCCEGVGCGATYPIVDGIPILINEENSIFSIGDFVEHNDTTFNLGRSKLRRVVDRLSPDITSNVEGRRNFELFADKLLEDSTRPMVLVIGGGIVGQHMEPLIDNANSEMKETDVSFGPRTSFICDGHDLPFEDRLFDGVVAQAVLEHVADPYRCVEEMYRVLKPDGLVFADTPFMQQGHMGPYDFTRFTHLGHRRLFRRFTEIESGVGCGPGTALAWAYRYFLLSFASKGLHRSLLSHFASFTSFYLKYFDRFLNHKTGAYDSASSFFFIGRKSSSVVSDKELIGSFRGHG